MKVLFLKQISVDTKVSTLVQNCNKFVHAIRNFLIWFCLPIWKCQFFAIFASYDHLFFPQIPTYPCQSVQQNVEQSRETSGRMNRFIGRDRVQKVPKLAILDQKFCVQICCKFVQVTPKMGVTFFSIFANLNPVRKMTIFLE